MSLIVRNLALQAQKLENVRKVREMCCMQSLKSHKVGPEFYHPATNLLKSLGRQLLSYFTDCRV
jgi:hypothetical protein